MKNILPVSLVIIGNIVICLLIWGYYEQESKEQKIIIRDYEDKIECMKTNPKPQTESKD